MFSQLFLFNLLSVVFAYKKCSTITTGGFFPSTCNNNGWVKGYQTPVSLQCHECSAGYDILLNMGTSCHCVPRVENVQSFTCKVQSENEYIRDRCTCTKLYDPEPKPLCMPGDWAYFNTITDAYEICPEHQIEGGNYPEPQEPFFNSQPKAQEDPQDPQDPQPQDPQPQYPQPQYPQPQDPQPQDPQPQDPQEHNNVYNNYDQSMSI
eukprot:Pgem_evm1s2448